MGSYTFKWEHPEANEVYVTGTFDDWGKTQKLDKLPSGFFEKTVSLPSKEKVLYKFVVDTNWTTNSHLPTETDDSGNVNNVLQPSDIMHPTDAAISTVGATSTTAALAGAVPKESEKTVSAPGAFPETPAAEPASFSVNPIPASEGAGNPISLKPGEPVPDASAVSGNTISSGVHDDEELKAADKAAGEQTFGVSPIPATSGVGNPIKLAPGEPVPDPSTLTDNTVQSTVKTDEASYNASDAAPPAPVSKEAEPSAAETGAFGVLPVGKTTLPESSIGTDQPATKDPGPGAGIFAATVGAAATTLGLAAAVPKEPRGVPEVVTESQQAAHVDPEASASPVAVEEKKEMEAELKSKVPVEPPAAESGLPTGKIAAAVTGGVAAAGAAATAAAVSAKNVATNASSVAQGMASETVAQPPTEEVPEVVKESIAEAHTSAEAAASPEAVKEKAAVEAELESKVKPVESAGEPAPTVTAATTETAPEPTTSSLGLNAGAAAPATTPATKENVKPETTDVAAAAPTNGATTTTGVATESISTPAKSEASPSTPSKPTESTTATPASAASASTSATGDKKKKRRSVFMEKIKKILH